MGKAITSKLGLIVDNDQRGKKKENARKKPSGTETETRDPRIVQSFKS